MKISKEQRIFRDKMDNKLTFKRQKQLLDMLLKTSQISQENTCTGVSF